MAKIDLYAILGVPLEASVADIRKAYRKMAKSAHPDAGGSPDRFALVKLAHDVLTDPERRKTYDETGEIKTPEPDQTEAQAMNVVTGVINSVLGQLGGREPGEIDILKIAGDSVRANTRQVIQNIGIHVANAGKLRKIAKRFTAKKDKLDRIRPMIEAQAAEQEREAGKLRETRKVLERAIEILDDHEFEWTAPAKPWGVTAGGIYTMAGC